MRETALFIISGLMLVCFIGTLIQAWRMSEMASERLFNERDRTRAQQDYVAFRSWSVMYLVLAAVAMIGTIVTFAAARGYIE